MAGLGVPGDDPPVVEDHRSVAAAGEVLGDDVDVLAKDLGDSLWLAYYEGENELSWLRASAVDLEAWR
jgi:hypothetical protein